MRRPDQAWIKYVSLDLLSAALLDLAGIAESVENKLSVLDLEYYRQAEAKRATAERAQSAIAQGVAAIPKPTRPTCHPREQHPGGAWNGKYYGKAGCHNYYVSGERYTLTDAEHSECMSYRAAMDGYNKAVEAAQKGVSA